jgi:hypothetical protein
VQLDRVQEKTLGELMTMMMMLIEMMTMMIEMRMVDDNDRDEDDG